MRFLKVLGYILFYGCGLYLYVMSLIFYYSLWGLFGLIVAIAVFPAAEIFPIVLWIISKQFPWILFLIWGIGWVGMGLVAIGSRKDQEYISYSDENSNIKEPIKMNKLKKTLMIVAIVSIIVIAGSVLYYYVFKPDLRQRTVQVSINSTTALTVDPVSDYTKRLEEYNTYYAKWNSLGNYMTADAVDKLHNAKTGDEQAVYAKILLADAQKMYEEASGMEVPGFAKELHKHVLESFTQYKAALSCLINYDPPGYSMATGKITTETNLIDKELAKITEDFNKEAKELGLPIPFPNK